MMLLPNKWDITVYRLLKKDEDFMINVSNYAIENADRVFRTASVSGGALLKRRHTISASKKKKDEDFMINVSNYAIENADRVFRTASVSGGALLKRRHTISASKKEQKYYYATS